MSAPIKKVLILPIEARAGDHFLQCCEVCDGGILSGSFAIAIQITTDDYDANFLLGDQVDCPYYGQLNTLIAMFNDETDVETEMFLIKTDIDNTNGIIRVPLVPDISQKDLDEIFEK